MLKNGTMVIIIRNSLRSSVCWVLAPRVSAPQRDFLYATLREPQELPRGRP